MTHDFPIYNLSNYLIFKITILVLMLVLFLIISSAPAI
ncbi:hypothetical protein NIES2111_52650 [Nostoc sp. NIES-2111]|nr:hypothetical protein NIES2111_52650 [Nostoc sp. NIES-2111]